MSEALAWSATGLLAGLFAAVNAWNLRLIFSAQGDEDRSGGSPVIFVGGIAGALALFVMPIDGVRDWWWLALVVDLGTAPFLTLGFVLPLVGSQGSPRLFRRIPSTRYPAPKPEPSPLKEPVTFTPLMPLVTNTVVGKCSKPTVPVS